VGEYLERAFRGLGHVVDHFNMREAEQCHARYDAYLRIDYGDYAIRLPQRFRPSAFYVVDTHLVKSLRAIRRQIREYDVLFCVQQQVAQQFPRAHWIPLGCDPEFHQAAARTPRFDLAFVGNDGGVPRKFYLQELRERYPNSLVGQAPHTQMATIYAQAKIGFNYLECPSPFRDNVSMRVFEVLAAGRLLLTNALSDGAFEALGLRNREELVLYRTPRELFDLIEYYLTHDEERERIAKAGQVCVLERHTYRHRAEAMVKVLERRMNA
jgi:glycosyltransferase involved in cell wall biosynthesis